jgi:hypothetical protein
MPIWKNVACSAVSLAASHIDTVLIATSSTYNNSADSIGDVCIGIACSPSAVPCHRV